MTTSHPDIAFLYALILFTVGIIVATILMSATVVITRRPKHSGPVYADITKLAVDRLVLNCSTSVLILMECGTLIWDSISPLQFPVWARWPVDTVAVLAIGFAALRLITQYVRIHAQINNGDAICPKNGYKCTAKPNSKYVELRRESLGN